MIKQDAQRRKSWTGGHIAAGSASVFLAFANVFIGLKVLVLDLLSIA